MKTKVKKSNKAFIEKISTLTIGTGAKPGKCTCKVKLVAALFEVQPMPRSSQKDEQSFAM